MPIKIQCNVSHAHILHTLMGNGKLIMLDEVCHLLLITVSPSYPQSEAEQEPCGLAQCG